MSSVVAALGLPHAKPVPTLGASIVGMSFALARSVPTLEPVDNSAPVCNLWITWGGPCVDTGGRGLTCVNYCCSHLCSQEGKFRLKLAKKSISYPQDNPLFYLVFTQRGHKCTKSVRL